MLPDSDINHLLREAQIRWLKPAEVLYILQNHEKYQFTQEPPQKPTSGSLFLFNKRVMRYFRKDGHNWRKKRHGRSVGEAHEKLKVGNVETLKCYYAHGEENPSFQRRSYWMLDPAYEHIVLVHYRETNQERLSCGPVGQLSPGGPGPGPSSIFSQSTSSHSSENLGTKFLFGDLYEEFTSDIVIKNNGVNHLDGMDAESGLGSEIELTQVLCQLEKQLSFSDNSFKEVAAFSRGHENADNPVFQHKKGEICNEDKYAACHVADDHGPCYNGHTAIQDGSGVDYNEIIQHDCPSENENSLSWTEDVLRSHQSSCMPKSPEKHIYNADGKEKQLFSSGSGPIANQENIDWLNFGSSKNAENYASSLLEGVGGVKFSAYPSMVGTQETNSDYYSTLVDQNHIGAPLDGDSRLTVAQTQKFTIRTVSPEWGYATENTKVIIVGSFLSPPSDYAWACMFGEVEVPVEIIQDGVICCDAPPHLPGKVTLCITSGNRESCSEVREFEYCNKTSSCSQCKLLETKTTRSPEELLLLVRLAQMLLSDSCVKNENMESGNHLLRELKADDESWGHVIETLLVGSGTSSDIVDWLLVELVKDKMLLWLSSKSQERNEETACCLSKREQGIIHMVAGLGYEWALNPILSSGVNINFRDIRGWTALHWAAHFGREKMVASLVASGASAQAVTDPSQQDPTGRTAAFVAASSGHEGLAAYLSVADLTSHASSLTLKESELAKGSAELIAESAVCGVSKENLTASEDQLPFKDTLDAVRDAARAAALIQAVFRAHSFRKRKERESAAIAASISEGSFDNIPELSAISKLTFGNARDYNSAALSIQKKYRGWKGRKDFLALRHKVVKIQAHVRGYQARKHYMLICWAVGIWDKMVLRWRRKGVGLRGFQHEMESTDDSEDDDFLRAFRKQKVYAAIAEAFSQVLSMVNSRDARQQYHRILNKFRQAKAKIGSTSQETSSTLAQDVSNMDHEGLGLFAMDHDSPF